MYLSTSSLLTFMAKRMCMLGVLSNSAGFHCGLQTFLCSHLKLGMGLNTAAICEGFLCKPVIGLVCRYVVATVYCECQLTS